jgi:hypothetical protein
MEQSFERPTTSVTVLGDLLQVQIAAMVAVSKKVGIAPFTSRAWRSII